MGVPSPPVSQYQRRVSGISAKPSLAGTCVGTGVTTMGWAAAVSGRPALAVAKQAAANTDVMVVLMRALPGSRQSYGNLRSWKCNAGNGPVAQHKGDYARLRGLWNESAFCDLMKSGADEPPLHITPDFHHIAKMSLNITLLNSIDLSIIYTTTTS